MGDYRLTIGFAAYEHLALKKQDRCLPAVRDAAAEAPCRALFRRGRADLGRGVLRRLPDNRCVLRFKGGPGAAALWQASDLRLHSFTR